MLIVNRYHMATRRFDQRVPAFGGRWDMDRRLQLGQLGEKGFWPAFSCIILRLGEGDPQLASLSCQVQIQTGPSLAIQLQPKPL